MWICRSVSFFILDEADRMLDMGFYDDIMQIVRQLPKERQTLMSSATMPEDTAAGGDDTQRSCGGEDRCVEAYRQDKSVGFRVL